MNKKVSQTLLFSSFSMWGDLNALDSQSSIFRIEHLLNLSGILEEREGDGFDSKGY